MPKNVQTTLQLHSSHTQKALVIHSSTLVWKIPWTEELGELQSMGSLRVRRDWVTSLSLFTFVHWRRKWQPTPVLLSGESQGLGKPGGLPSMELHRVGHDWIDLAAAAKQGPSLSVLAVPAFLVQVPNTSVYQISSLVDKIIASNFMCLNFFPSYSTFASYVLWLSQQNVCWAQRFCL